MTLGVACILCGLAGVVWGLPAMHRLRQPFDILAAITVLAGVISSVIGALIVSVPGFFKGL